MYKDRKQSIIKDGSQLRSDPDYTKTSQMRSASGANNEKTQATQGND